METTREQISVAETIRLFGIGRTKLYELIGSGEVVAVKLGRRTLIDIESVRRFFAGLPRAGGDL